MGDQHRDKNIIDLLHELLTAVVETCDISAWEPKELTDTAMTETDAGEAFSDWMIQRLVERGWIEWTLDDRVQLTDKGLAYAVDVEGAGWCGDVSTQQPHGGDGGPAPAQATQEATR